MIGVVDKIKTELGDTSEVVRVGLVVSEVERANEKKKKLILKKIYIIIIKGGVI